MRENNNQLVPALFSSLAALLFSTDGFAASYGIGMSAKSGESEILFPINLSSDWRIEPSIRYSKDKRTNTFSDGTYYSRTTTTSTTYTVSLGIFRQQPMPNSFNYYYGLRFGYGKVYSKSGLYDPDYFQPVSESTSESSIKYVAPTFGIDYLINEKISLAGEINYAMSETEGDSDSMSGAQSDTEGFNLGSNSRIILRYFF